MSFYFYFRIDHFLFNDAALSVIFWTACASYLDKIKTSGKDARLFDAFYRPGARLVGAFWTLQTLGWSVRAVVMRRTGGAKHFAHAEPWTARHKTSQKHLIDFRFVNGIRHWYLGYDWASKMLAALWHSFYIHRPIRFDFWKGFSGKTSNSSFVFSHTQLLLCRCLHICYLPIDGKYSRDSIFWFVVYL